jgi:dolichol-phosphate mannosyltransferase
VLVSLATYNESENLPQLLPQILSLVPEAQVLIIDDNSPDGTGIWCQEQARRDHRIDVRIRSHKLGLGTANLTAMQYAIDGDYDVLVTMDADRSHDPNRLPAMINALADASSQDGGLDSIRADVVIGSRYVQGGSIQNWPWNRRWTSRIVNAFARRLLQIPIADCSSGYRCYRVACLAELDLRELKSVGFSFYEEILVFLHCAGAKFVEIPIEFVDRTRGRSKANWRESMRSAFSLLRLARRLRTFIC